MANEPVWKRPGWITAMVGVFTALLTVPGVVGEYFAKEQDVKIAEQQVVAARLGNAEAKQSQEFSVIQNVLAQQGDERIFMLRYFAATLEDPDAKAWAAAEVEGLDNITALKAEVRRGQIVIEEKENQLLALGSATEKAKQLQTEIATLQTELSNKDSQVSELRDRAGIESEQSPNPIFHLRFEVDWKLAERDFITVSTSRSLFPVAICRRDEGNVCRTFVTGSPPDQLRIVGSKQIPDVEAGELPDTGSERTTFGSFSYLSSIKTLSDLKGKKMKAGVLQGDIAAMFTSALVPKPIYRQLRYVCSTAPINTDISTTSVVICSLAKNPSREDANLEVPR